MGFLVTGIPGVESGYTFYVLGFRVLGRFWGFWVWGEGAWDHFWTFIGAGVRKSANGSESQLNYSLNS